MVRRLLLSAKVDWPFAVVFIGLPLWWLLGVWQMMFFAMSIPMAVFLMKQRVLRMPKGFGMWLLWLGWVLTGVLVMQVDVPGTILGSESTRYLTFGYRFGWYVIATIAALYVLNTKHLVESERITRSIAWMFVMVVAGGLLGLLVPTFNMPSAIELVLPASLAKQPFVHDLIHVQVAQIQGFLGYDEARPSAPFAYTNDWGLATAVTMPFFVAAWSKRGRGWRISMVVVMLVAAFTIVSSLNRGTWAAILAMVAFVVLRSAVLGRVKLLLASGVMMACVGAILALSPLGDLMMSRFANPHSDEGRSNLSLMAVRSVLENSPIVGFGTTRDVSGNFASIAGGASDLCPSCSPPPLGTHGQLWLVSFGAGIVGVIIFFGFLLQTMLRNLRASSAGGIAALCALIAIAVTATVYNSNEVQLYVALIGVGLLAREYSGELPTLKNAIRPVRQFFPAVVALSLCGGVIGGAYHAYQGTAVEATQRVLVPAANLLGVPGVRPLSLDGEALLATSDAVVESVATSLGVSPDEARDALRIGAEPNTRVLLISYYSKNPAQAVSGAEHVSTAYLAQRSQLIADANASVVARYSGRGTALDAIYSATRPLAEDAGKGFLWNTVRELREARSTVAEALLNVTDADAGQQISAATVRHSSSVMTIRVASGMGLGALVGLLVIYVYDRRLLRVGRHPETRLGLDVPVIAWVSPSDLVGAQHAIRAYLPVAGVIADPGSERARKLTARLDDKLDRSCFGGTRAVMVVDPDSRAGAVRRAFDDQVRAGVHPVGLIMCAGARHRHRLRRLPRRQN